MNDYKTPPHSPEAELAVLGSLTNDCRDEAITMDVISTGLTSEHFHSPLNANLYEYVVEKYKSGEKYSAIEIATYAISHPEKYGSASDIAGLFRYSETFHSLKSHIGLLKMLHTRRKIIYSCTDSINRAYNLDSNYLKLLQNQENLITEIRDDRSPTTEGASISEATDKLVEMWKSVKENNGMRGLSFGIPKLDLELGGMAKGDLVVFAGAPSMGKSVSMLQAASASMSEGKRVLIFSLEMEQEQVAARLYSCLCGVDFSKTLTGLNCTKFDFKKIKEGAETIKKSNSRIFDAGDQSIEYIETISKVENDRCPVDLIVIDYYQLIESPDHKDDLKRLEYVSRRLKQLAKTIKVPLVTGAQLNEHGKVHGSKALGKDANILLRIHADDKNSGYVVDKSRNTQRGQFIPCSLNGAKQRFE